MLGGSTQRRTHARRSKCWNTAGFRRHTTTCRTAGSAEASRTSHAAVGSRTCVCGPGAAHGCNASTGDLIMALLQGILVDGGTKVLGNIFAPASCNMLYSPASSHSAASTKEITGHVHVAQIQFLHIDAKSSCLQSASCNFSQPRKSLIHVVGGTCKAFAGGIRVPRSDNSRNRRLHLPLPCNFLGSTFTQGDPDTVGSLEPISEPFPKWASATSEYEL